jgi:hypothetical protein
MISTNLVGTINCLDFARTHGAAVVFLSTSRVYPIALDAPALPDIHDKKSAKCSKDLRLGFNTRATACWEKPGTAKRTLDSSKPATTLEWHAITFKAGHG